MNDRKRKIESDLFIDMAKHRFFKVAKLMGTWINCFNFEHELRDDILKFFQLSADSDLMPEDIIDEESMAIIIVMARIKGELKDTIVKMDRKDIEDMSIAKAKEVYSLAIDMFSENYPKILKRVKEAFTISGEPEYSFDVLKETAILSAKEMEMSEAVND